MEHPIRSNHDPVLHRTPASFGLIAVFLASVAVAQEPPPAEQASAEHKILALDEGTWDATIKTYMGGPAAEPSLSQGTEVNEVLPGGLWVLSKFEGEFGGVKILGRGQYGYDPVKKKYVGTWLDSISSSLSVLEGDYDARTKTMTFVGDGYDSARKLKFAQRMVTTAQDDGSRVFSLFMKFAGQPAESKLMEITYAKRPGDADRQAIQGTWLPEAAEIAGQEFPVEVRKSIKLVITGDKYTVTMGDQVDEGKVVHDPSKSPKTMTITGTQGPNKGKTLLAIYQIKGDSLQVCYDLSGKTFPEVFQTKPDTKRLMVTYKRATD